MKKTRACDSYIHSQIDAKKNYPSGDVIFRYLTLGEKDMNKSVQKSFLCDFNFPMRVLVV